MTKDSVIVPDKKKTSPNTRLLHTRKDVPVFSRMWQVTQSAVVVELYVRLNNS